MVTASQLYFNLKDFKLDECNLNKNKNRFLKTSLKKVANTCRHFKFYIYVVMHKIKL